MSLHSWQCVRSLAIMGEGDHNLMRNRTPVLVEKFKSGFSRGSKEASRHGRQFYVLRMQLISRAMVEFRA